MRPEEKSALPYGLQFAEEPCTLGEASQLSLSYDNDADCTMIVDNSKKTPFVEAAISCVRTLTVTKASGEEPDDGADEHTAAMAATLLTQTETKNIPESPDVEDTYQSIAAFP